jgi:hypothetical protein
MSYDPNEDRRPYELFTCYMRGWRHGAAASGMDAKFTKHKDGDLVAEYDAGYTAGYLDRQKVQTEAAERLGYTPRVIRTVEAHS